MSAQSEYDSESETVTSEEPQRSDGRCHTDGSLWAVSVCFWVALTVAASSYAAVALAPKLSVWLNVRREYLANARQLSALEEQVDYLERVKTTLETDPEFVQRLAQSTQGEQQHDTEAELIPVSGNLIFGQGRTELLNVPAKTEPPAHLQIVTSLASQPHVRTGLLAFAAGLVIFAFAFLNDAGQNLVVCGGRLLKSLCMVPVARYTATPPTTEETLADD